MSKKFEVRIPYVDSNKNDISREIQIGDGASLMITGIYENENNLSGDEIRQMVDDAIEAYGKPLTNDLTISFDGDVMRFKKYVISKEK